MNENVESEIFGSYDGQMVLEKGWLTSETVVQFKLYNNPIHLWKKKLQNRKVSSNNSAMMMSDVDYLILKFVAAKTT